jgi:diguanylate cyclase (GGDEF)-like protein/PAS domain S-box-containing protein
VATDVAANGDQYVNPEHYQRKLRQMGVKDVTRPKPAAATEAASKPVEELLRKLQTHQVELETQNEELRQAHAALRASRDRYLDLYEYAPTGYLTIDKTGQITEANLKAGTMLGVEREHLVGRHFALFIAGQDKDRWHHWFLRMKKTGGGKEQDFDLALIRNDGTTMHAHVNCRCTGDAGAPRMLRISLTDITRLIEAETQLRIAAAAFESQEGMAITDANNVILKVNKAFTTITGYSAAEVIGRTPPLLASGRHDAAFYTAIRESVQSTGTWQGEIWNRRKNGEIYTEWLTITAVRSDDGKTSHHVAILSDISQKKAESEQIERLAFHDTLTSLPNRRLLMDRLNQALALSDRNGRAGAIMFIDLDNFKTLNDTHGHDMGDLLLQQVAQRLLSCVREGDTVARLGGDEFVVMLEDLNETPEDAAHQAEITAKKILGSLENPYRLGDLDYRCTSSIGVVLFNGHLASTDDLLKRVDVAMYQAKHAGRNALCFSDISF